LEANESWPFPETRPVYRLEFYFGTPDFLFQLFERGKIDIMSYPTTDQLTSLPSHVSHHLQSSPQWAVHAVYFRMPSKLVNSSKDFRMAAFSRLSGDALVSQIKTGDRPASGVVPPGLVGARETPWSNDARGNECKHLAAKRLRVIRDTRALSAIHQWVFQQLRPLGEKCGLKATQVDQPVSSRPDGTLDVVVTHWRFDDGDALPIFELFHSRTGNGSGFSNSGFDALVELAKKESDRSSTILQMNKMLESQEAWVHPLTHSMSHFLVGPRVVGFSITPRGEPDFTRIQLKDVTAPTQ
jgi:ABC-type oligopeptide transport system substrate-binding subunit